MRYKKTERDAYPQTYSAGPWFLNTILRRKEQASLEGLQIPVL